MFKKELECSFIEFSGNNTCQCPVHTIFGMNFIDVQAPHDTAVLVNNRFCIQIDPKFLLDKLKEEKLDSKTKLGEIEDQLFYFFQNTRFKKPLQSEVDEFCVQVQGSDNAQFLTFRLEMPKKSFKNLPQSLALFLAMMPQYLSGEEFKYIDVDSNDFVNSPRGQIHAILAFNKDKFATFVDVEGDWMWFQDETVKKVNFYENVIETMLVNSLFPNVLIYKVCPSPLQKKNTEVSSMLYEFMEMHEGKKLGKNMQFSSKVSHNIYYEIRLFVIKIN